MYQWTEKMSPSQRAMMCHSETVLSQNHVRQPQRQTAEKGRETHRSSHGRLITHIGKHRVLAGVSRFRLTVSTCLILVS